MAAQYTNLYPGVSVGNLQAASLGKWLPLFDPRRHTQHFDDFHEFVAANWTLTKTGAATTALSAIHGGALLFTNSNGTTDVNSAQHVTTDFAFAANREAWMEFRFQASDVTHQGLVLGLAVTTTTPFTAPSDYVYWKLAAGGTAFSFLTGTGSAQLQAGATTLTPVAAQWCRLGMYWDGLGTIRLFGNANDVAGGGPTQGLGKITGAFASLLPTALLRPTIAQINSTAITPTLTVDYSLTMMERV